MAQAATSDAMRRQQYVLPKSSEPDVEPLMALSGGESMRLVGFLELAKEKGLVQDGVWLVAAAVINISQSAKFCGQVDSETMPTLLTRSELFDMVSNRKLLVPELFLVQGYPHPELVRVVDVPFFPFVVSYLENLPVRHATKLLGNGMHLQAVGSMILHIWANTAKTLEEVM